MKTTLIPIAAAAVLHATTGLASQPGQASPASVQPTEGHVLSRHELHALTEAARGVEAFIRRTPHLGTRVWPHAVRDGQGRAGLIIMAHRPLLMSMNLEDLDQRRNWVLAALIAAGWQMESTPARVDHLALTDPEGMRGQQWYYDVDMALARRLFLRLREGTLSAEAAYRQVVSSWRLVTAESQLTAR